MPPRRSSRITGRQYSAQLRSKLRSSSATDPPASSSHDSLSETPTSSSAATPAVLPFESSENAASMLTSPDRDITSRKEDLSPAATSTHEPPEEILAPASPGKLDGGDKAQVQTLASLSPENIDVRDGLRESMIAPGSPGKLGVGDGAGEKTLAGELDGKVDVEDGAQEKTLNPVLPGERDVGDGAQEKHVMDSDLPAPDMSGFSATEDEKTGTKFISAQAEDCIERENVSAETKTVVGSAKKKIVKKKVKIVKVVKRVVSKKVVKDSLQTEDLKEANVPVLRRHNQNGISEPTTNGCSSPGNGDPVPFGTDLVDTENGNLTTGCTSVENGDPVPFGIDLVDTKNGNLTKTVSLEVGKECLKEAIDQLVEVENVRPASEDAAEGESAISAGVSTSGIPLESASDDGTDGMGEELVEAQVQNQDMASLEIKSVAEILLDQNISPMEDDVYEGEVAVKDVDESVGVGSNAISAGVSTSGIILESASDDGTDGMREELVEAQVQNQDMASMEIKSVAEILEDQNVSPMEDDVYEGEVAVKDVDESVGVGSNAIVTKSSEMEALERKRKRRTEIFIGGLDKDVKEADIRRVFEQIGNVKKVRLMMDSKTGKNRGFAFLRFASAADANEALANYSDVEICGKKCGARPVEGNDTIFLGNINKKWKSAEVLELVKKAGIEKIDCVTVMSDPSNLEQNRGFAFLEIETSRDAQFAFRKLQNDSLIKEKNITIAWAQPLVEPNEEELQKVKSIYAELLPSSWDEERARNLFQRFGEIESISLAKNLPSSKRKDFAFVNYKSREDALACIKAFNHDLLDIDGSKVPVKVSLARPMGKSKKMKQVSVSVRKETSVDKLKTMQPISKVHEHRNPGRPPISSYNTFGVDRSISTNNELIQLLRNQASGGLSRAGPSELSHGYPMRGHKRPFPLVKNYSPSFDPRGHPRLRSETSYSNADASAFPHPVRTAPMPYFQERTTSYPFAPETAHEIQNYHHLQMTRRAPYLCYSGHYQRY